MEFPGKSASGCERGTKGCQIISSGCGDPRRILGDYVSTEKDRLAWTKKRDHADLIADAGYAVRCKQDFGFFNLGVFTEPIE